MTVEHNIKISGDKVDIDAIKEALFDNTRETTFDMDRILPPPPELLDGRELRLGYLGYDALTKDDDFFQSSVLSFGINLMNEGKKTSWIETNGPITCGIQAVKILQDIRPEALEMGHKLIRQRIVLPDYTNLYAWRTAHHGVDEFESHYMEDFSDEGIVFVAETDETPEVVAIDLMRKWFYDHFLPVDVTWYYRESDDDGEFPDDWDELY